MKLLLIFTGGTIGSTFDGAYIATDSDKPYVLLDTYKKIHPMPDYDTDEPFTMLSENATGTEISALIRCVGEKLGAYDGIIITHGTDTLQYTAAALSYAFGTVRTPICLVSSNFPIEHEKANGIDNLFGAVSLLKQGTEEGVFVSYRNPGDPDITIHRAARLLASAAYSDSFFSVCGKPYGWISSKSGAFTKNPEYSESPDAQNPLRPHSLSPGSDSILRIFPYPGMTYPILPPQTRAILHESFHSGTINTLSPDARRFFAHAKEQGIPVFLTGVSSGDSYESTSVFEELGMIPLPVISPIAAYLKLWFADACGYDLKTALMLPLGGDF